MFETALQLSPSTLLQERGTRALLGILGHSGLDSSRSPQGPPGTIRLPTLSADSASLLLLCCPDAAVFQRARPARHPQNAPYPKPDLGYLEANRPLRALTVDRSCGTVRIICSRINAFMTLRLWPSPPEPSCLICGRLHQHPHRPSPLHTSRALSPPRGLVALFAMLPSTSTAAAAWRHGACGAPCCPIRGLVNLRQDRCSLPLMSSRRRRRAVACGGRLTSRSSRVRMCGYLPSLLVPSASSMSGDFTSSPPVAFSFIHALVPSAAVINESRRLGSATPFQ
ncbi:uncharacterized protein J3D65DRAFT_137609 [Phyllosticta citribraziliensis]|uniref:Uncharacterized protein n=1 Tax=Phyllosticta citribraziliensis TaxID=989973 RepID=A0ABR1L8T0_9PEZI